MNDPDSITLGLELNRHEEPITGRLRKPDGATTPFVGWLELTQALEDARLTDPASERPQRPELHTNSLDHAAQ